MPRNVTLFERLMYASLLLSVAVLALDGPRLMDKPEVRAAGGLTFVFITLLVTIALIALFVWLIARKRQNWARWVFTLFFIIGLWPFAQNLMEMLQASPVATVASGVQLAMQAAALYFVFTGDAVPWFSKTQPA